VRFDEPLSRHTTLGVGGPVDAMVAPEDLSALQDLVGWACGRGIAYFVIGKGSNLVVPDAGVGAIAISLRRGFGRIRCLDPQQDPTKVCAGAGAGLASLCRFALDRGLAGMTFALGIPATVGGAVRMNAGAAGGCMADVVHAVRVMTPEGAIVPLSHDAIRWSYRNACLPHSPKGTWHTGSILLEGILRMGNGDPVALRKEAERILEWRKKSHPPMPNAGCFFRNPTSGSPAGQLIERAGLKGRRWGGAQVSPVHANFIVNTGGATAADVLGLMETVREEVAKAFGIELEPEVQIVAV